MPRRAPQDLVRDRVHQVGLAEADAAVEKQRVVGARRGLRRRRARPRARTGSRSRRRSVSKVKRGFRTRPRGGSAGRAAERGPARRTRTRGARSGSRGQESPSAGGLAGEEIAVARLDPVGEDAARNRRRSGRASPGRSAKATCRVGLEPGLQLLGVELVLQALENGGPDFRSCDRSAFSTGFSTAVESLWQPGAGSIAARTVGRE